MLRIAGYADNTLRLLTRVCWDKAGSLGRGMGARVARMHGKRQYGEELRGKAVQPRRHWLQQALASLRGLVVFFSSFFFLNVGDFMNGAGFL